MALARKLAFAAILGTLAATPVLAGNSKMKSADGTQVQVTCTGGGCEVRSKAPGGKWATVERTKGGSQNYEALMAKYKGMGFK